MLDKSELLNMYPVIMTPSHDGKYFYNYTLSLLNLVHKATSMGMNIQVALQRGESLITRARNNCVAEFMANPEWTHLCFIDSDIGFSHDAFFRLLLADRDVAAGVYPLKKEDWPKDGLPKGMTQEQFNTQYAHYTVNYDRPDPEIHINVDKDGFLSIDQAPTGFMVIKRAVFEKMMKAYPELAYRPDDDYSKDQGFHYRFFDCMVHPESKRYLSEDYHFCYLWQQLGGEIALDVCSNLTHQGAKVYTGSFANSLVENLARAITSPKGIKMHLNLEAPLTPNERIGG
ncbi:hypothetical protein B0181_05590 [Moraxella caviae]|uniref:Uncharacterized protein n=1 Tax=Moraxella caviae TaxID=34060 RepID=A0A1T0A2G4_9GAMM|nr:hypothetical protein [Moraxella caviae]OOR89885.1 hypothetical protein B0181_05590 [Moraxella caviae]STZ14270.1 Uncharacterised protein [Moraxella caviae]